VKGDLEKVTFAMFLNHSVIYLKIFILKEINGNSGLFLLPFQCTAMIASKKYHFQRIQKKNGVVIQLAHAIIFVPNLLNCTRLSTVKSQ